MQILKYATITVYHESKGAVKRADWCILESHCPSSLAVFGHFCFAFMALYPDRFSLPYVLQPTSTHTCMHKQVHTNITLCFHLQFPLGAGKCTYCYCLFCILKYSCFFCNFVCEKVLVAYFSLWYLMHVTVLYSKKERDTHMVHCCSSFHVIYLVFGLA